MRIYIDLSESQEDQLRMVAKRLGVEPPALAQAAVTDLLNRGAGNFGAAAEFVLRKNRELYKRLD